MIENKYDSSSKSSILEYAKILEGKSLKDSCGDIAISSRANKGNFGTLLEEFYFGYKPNSNSEADFYEAELELKSTPLRRLKNGEWVCKERLVLNIINYLDIPYEDFMNSSFWKKNKNLLLVFYLWERELLPLDYVIDLVGIWDFPQKDLKIIQRDWNLIKSKITSGQAHLLSEGDTIYLGACTKGSTSEKSFRKQPFSDELAKQRAFSLKRSYLNTIYNSLNGSIEYDSILSESELDEGSFDDLIVRKIEPYFSLSVKDIQSRLGLELNQHSKNYFSSISNRIIKRILGVSEEKFIEEFEKASITIKSIRVEENGRIKENISLPAFKFEDLIEEDWNDSILKDTIENKFLFVFYKKNAEQHTLERAGFWNLSSKDMDEFERVFNVTKEIIKSGEIIRDISEKGIVRNNFPKLKDSYLTHIRPHATNRDDTYSLPVPDKKTKQKEFTKQSFWINSSYVEMIYRALS